MKFANNPVDIDFLDNAPLRWETEVELNASAKEVFALFEDGEVWPKWYKDMKKVTWTSPKPFKVGTTRTVYFRLHMGNFTLDEYFYRWEDDVRFTFYGVASNLPLVKAMAEDYHLIPTGENTCKFVYTVAVDPDLMLKVSSIPAKMFFTNLFKRACNSLKVLIDERNAAK